jgi:hypothetical protein
MMLRSMGVPWGFGLAGTGGVNVGRDAGVVKISGNWSNCSPDERSDIRVTSPRANPHFATLMRATAERGVRDILEHREFLAKRL